MQHVCLKTSKTQNGPAHWTKRIRNCGISGIFYQVYSKGILFFFNDIESICQAFQIKRDLLVILKIFKLNLVICLHSSNAHMKKKNWHQTWQFQRHNVHETFSEAAKIIFKVSFLVFRYCLQTYLLVNLLSLRHQSPVSHCITRQEIPVFQGNGSFPKQPTREDESRGIHKKLYPAKPEHPPGIKLHHALTLQTDGSQTSQRNIKKTKPRVQQIMRRLIEKMWTIENKNNYCSRRAQLSVCLTAPFSRNLHFHFSFIHPYNILLLLAKQTEVIRSYPHETMICLPGQFICFGSLQIKSTEVVRLP